MRARPIKSAIGAVVIIGLGTAWLYAGPLNPPLGPIASTGKTLTEVEPRIAINATNTPGDADSLFKITQPGSYYLTGNITGVVGKHGIEITVSGVTLDLNGFDVAGVPGMGNFDGVTLTIASLSNIEVRNGTIRDWGSGGVDFATFPATSCVVKDVRASGNVAYGISAGSAATISGCTVHDNGTNGIATNTGCTIHGCTANSNGSTGISASTGCTIHGCTSNSNGSWGISAANGSTISGCTANFNASGILSTGASTISGCMVYSNGATGILAGNGSSIHGCTAWSNTTDGISVTSRCLVIANTCTNNGSFGDGAGIRASSVDNRIEGNTCTDADRGIDVDGTGNIIIKNTCAGNTVNWTIVANNVYGPIIDRTVPASAAVNGNSASDATGSTHPNANFTY